MRMRPLLIVVILSFIWLFGVLSGTLYGIVLLLPWVVSLFYLVFVLPSFFIPIHYIHVKQIHITHII